MGKEGLGFEICDLLYLMQSGQEAQPADVVAEAAAAHMSRVRTLQPMMHQLLP